MKKALAIFTLFILIFFIISCSDGSTENAYGNVGSTDGKNDSDTTSDKNEKTDTVSEYDDHDSGSSLPDDDSDTTHETESSTKREGECTGLPAGAVWNTASTITQTLDGDEWIPSLTGKYDTNPSSTECRYKCAENYKRINDECVAATRTAACTGLPAGPGPAVPYGH